jgi:hypothetical protein
MHKLPEAEKATWIAACYAIISSATDISGAWSESENLEYILADRDGGMNRREVAKTCQCHVTNVSYDSPGGLVFKGLSFQSRGMISALSTGKLPPWR